MFKPFLDGLQMLLEAGFRGGAQPGSFKVLLLGEGTYSDLSTLPQVLQYELTAQGYTRGSCTFSASVKDNRTVRLPTVRVNFTNPLSSPAALNYASVVLLADGDSSSHKAVQSIAGTRIGIPAHGRVENDRLFFTGTAPEGLTLLQIYYALPVDADHLEIAATPGGPPLTLGFLAGDLTCRFANGTLIAYKPNTPDGSGSLVRSINPGATKPIDISLYLRGE